MVEYRLAGGYLSQDHENWLGGTVWNSRPWGLKTTVSNLHGPQYQTVPPGFDAIR
ncbi:MAG: hypothetical protein IID37_10155 [Planctomycetes bacterium]|nr:hypothetical protein [Planctomycetota bacterium]